MKLTLGSCVCPHCGFHTELPLLPPGNYGEFLLWSEDGQCRYMCALNDMAYSEVGDIVDQVTGGSTESWQGADKLQKIFGPIACDRSPEGFAFNMRRLPRCPRCREFFLKFDRFVQPAVVLEVAVMPVSHLDWDRCTLDEKQSRVTSALQEIASAG